MDGYLSRDEYLGLGKKVTGVLPEQREKVYASPLSARRPATSGGVPIVGQVRSSGWIHELTASLQVYEAFEAYQAKLRARRGHGEYFYDTCDVVSDAAVVVPVVAAAAVVVLGSMRRA